MEDLVVWQGPVAVFQVPGATIPGAKQVFLNCCGDLTPPCTPPTCPDLGYQLMGSPSALLSRAKMNESDLGNLVLAGFSAGGSIIKRLLTNPDYRAMVTAVYGADATYTASWVDAQNRIPPAIEGYVQYGVDVVMGVGDKLMVLTASPVPNKSWASGVQNLRSIKDAIEQRTGMKFVERAGLFGVDPAPDRVWQLGNVLLAEYPLEPLGHGHTKIADQVFQNVIVPWIDKGKGLVDDPGGILVPPPGGEPPGPLPPPGVPVEGLGAWSLFVAMAAAFGGYYVVRNWGRR